MRGRKGDIVLELCQDNDEKTILVKNVYEHENTLESLLGYGKQELQNISLQKLLPHDIIKDIDDYVDFTDKGNDIASVLRKVRTFRMLTKGEQEEMLDMKIIHDLGHDDHDRYILMIRRPMSYSDPALTALMELEKNSCNRDTYNIPGKDAFFEGCSIVAGMVTDKKIKASISVIRVEHFGTFEEGATAEILHDTVLACKHTFRDSDFTAYMGRRQIAMILLGADFVNARIALNRLKWQFSSTSASESKVKFNIVYKEISAEENTEKTVKDCLTELNNPDSEVENVGVLR